MEGTPDPPQPHTLRSNLCGGFFEDEELKKLGLPSNSDSDAENSPIIKPSLNRRSRRRLAKEIGQVHYTLSKERLPSGQVLVELKKIMARPPGCSFLGSKAAQVPCFINSPTANASNIIIDSGSDITLISQSFLSTINPPPKAKIGQKINLVQVTGKASISGFVEFDLYFPTPEGPVKLEIKAYVVKGMTTPLILGNDFADQYSLSVIRRDGETFLDLGDCGRSLKIVSSTSTPYIDEDGHAFRVRVATSTSDSDSKRSSQESTEVQTT